jgi:hypothetical protein
MKYLTSFLSNSPPSSRGFLSQGTDKTDRSLEVSGPMGLGTRCEDCGRVVRITVVTDIGRFCRRCLYGK